MRSFKWEHSDSVLNLEVGTDAVSQYTKVTGRIIAETAAAILIRSEVGTEFFESWFPLSQVIKIVRAYEVSDGVTPDEIHVATWLAKKKGII